MADHGILFQDPMVRAILDGRKDVTRRTSHRWARVKVGDRLWVRECWRLAGTLAEPRVEYRADRTSRPATPKPGASVEVRPGWRPSMLMPRWASRITLEVTAIGLERGVYDDGTLLPMVTDEEARREGVADRTAYLELWASLNGEDSVLANNIWRIEFRRLDEVPVADLEVVLLHVQCHACREMIEVASPPSAGRLVELACPACEADVVVEVPRG